jgi:hypothetical protein
MTFIALPSAAAEVFALAPGEALWLRRTVTRSGEPASYWAGVVLFAGVALVVFSLGPVR